MKKIPLSKGLFATVDDEDFELVNSLKWCAICKKNKPSYAFNSKKGVKMHRYLLGVTDKNLWVDHRDGNGLNNCRDNIRVCTPAQNVMNRRKLKPTSSKYKGVRYRPKPKSYHAEIQFKGNYIFIGSFKNQDDAAKAYNQKAMELFGEFANLNEVPVLP